MASGSALLACIRDLAVESGIVADGSMTGVLCGWNYNRTVRLLKLVYEALLRLPWLGFYPWLKEDLRHVIPTIDAIRTLLHDICSDTLGTLVDNL